MPCQKVTTDYIPVPEPSQADLETACKAIKLLDNMSYGYYPINEEGAPIFFDAGNVEHLQILHQQIADIAANRHGVTRVICANGVSMTNSKSLVRHRTPHHAAIQQSEAVGGLKMDTIKQEWKRFSDELFRSSDAPYPGMIEAFEKHYGQSWTDREWRGEARTWAASWKAAVRHADMQSTKGVSK